ncbi:MAG: glycosyltransferase family 2 protein [Candidatus Krumholzibacteriota bacterium]|nr:glycosyltransferase family 2 protein [Candidatus Krumholzibacteriota bacterium]
MNNESLDLSVVVPVYNSEKTLVELHERLEAVFSKMGKTYEVIYINDCSQDKSLTVLQELYDKKDNVIVIDLFRNFGQQNALMCGFNHCSGRHVITLDDDLQNPPEEIEKLYSKIEEGFDAVFGAPVRKEDRPYKNLGSYMIRKLCQKIFNVQDDLRFSSFRIIRKEIIDEIKGMKTPFPYISGMLLSTTTSITNLDIQHHPRKTGSSGYTLKKLVKLAFNLLINYSSLPLRYAGFAGLTVSFVSLIIGIVIIIRKLVIGGILPGWTSIMVLISFYNALILIIFFFLGEYLSRFLREVTNEKQFSIKRILK